MDMRVRGLLEDLRHFLVRHQGATVTTEGTSYPFEVGDYLTRIDAVIAADPNGGTAWDSVSQRPIPPTK